MDGISFIEFETIMTTVAKAWSIPDTDMALQCFDDNAVYMEPPDIQLYIGKSQLRPYFDALTSDYYLDFHNIWFNETTQTGAVEYSFGIRGNEQCDTGIIVVEIRNRLIAFWREYQRKGPSDFHTFISQKGKQWQWHIGNYP